MKALALYLLIGSLLTTAATTPFALQTDTKGALKSKTPTAQADEYDMRPQGVTPTKPSITPTPNAGKIKPASTKPPDIILQVPVDAQDRALSCEASVAGMVAQFYKPAPPAGYSSWEEYFIKVIPLHCNPHRGFRGSIDGRQRITNLNCDNNHGPYGYGVYAEPIAAALVQVGINARVEYGVDYQVVEKAIKEGHPVLVWIFNPIYYKRYNSQNMKGVEVDPETNQQYIVIEGEHILVVKGVSADGKRFWVNDPYRGRTYWVSKFYLWEEFNGMKVIVGPAQ